MNTQRFRANPDYWDRKLANYLHDPPDKALRIPGHEERSCALLEILGTMSSPDKNDYQRADQIAAGMDRAQLPGYDPDDAARNGAIDFSQSPILTHPAGADPPLRLAFGRTVVVDDITRDIREIIRRDIDGHLEQPGLSNRFLSDPISFSPARFHYVHHVLRERLAEENVGGLGGVWNRIPADTRIPDHSIWQHCALVSSLASCFELSREKRASLLIFNITPVQGFISSARKLRDFWTGSLILSWLAFEGIRQVIYEFGSDHILYPSLIGQPLANSLLSRECGLSWLNSMGKGATFTGVASFPNKFVCLVPKGDEENTAHKIQQAILQAWVLLGDKTLELIENTISRKDDYLGKQFNRQMKSYWDFHWAACALLDENSHESIKQLLHKAIWERPLEFIGDARRFGYKPEGEGGLYAVTHALTQGSLAAGKTYRTNNREDEPGIKCSMHGELEALRFQWKEGADRNPRPALDPFWSSFKEAWEPKSDFKASERLSAVAMVKRLAYRVCKKLPDHPLNAFFEEAERFPSTTEMALADWLDRVARSDPPTQLGNNWRQKVAQYLHETESERREKDVESETADLQNEERTLCRKVIDSMERDKDPLQDDDKYYAVLLMDGDHMGRLVNGETVASTWRTVLHPELVRRLEGPKFDRSYSGFWQKTLDRPRLLAPAVHAAISEALSDFALFSVPPIINKYRGRLIYAGGDDVCAVLPVSTVLEAAREIACVYSRGFMFFPMDRQETPCHIKESWRSEAGRLALHLGAGPKISISAGILIVHHKRPLTVAMHRAHELLQQRAKTQGGRNGLALELDKRSGGARIFMAQWKEKPLEDLALEQNEQGVEHGFLLDHFAAVGKAMGSPGKRTMSVALAYRLEQFRPGLEALIQQAPRELTRFLVKHMERSRNDHDDGNNRLLASQLAALLARNRRETKEAELDTASIQVAKFIGGRKARMSRMHGEQL